MITLWTSSMAGINWFTQKEGLKLHDGSEMKPAVCSLVFYFIVWYFIMARQGISKAAVNAELLKSPSASKPENVAWFNNLDRSFGNMQEQCPMFLASFLTYSLLVSPTLGAYLGFAYSILTALYPALHPNPPMLATTFPRYLLIFYMMTGCVVAAMRS